MAEEKVCPNCGGDGQIQSEDGYSFSECKCAFLRRLRNWLGKEIATARTITESPLYAPGATLNDKPLLDRTVENLHIRGIWPDILSHLRWALACKGFDTSMVWRFKVVTDERLRSVWVGSEDYRNRSRKKRDEMETYNSLSDYIGPDVDLVIIRLGYLGYKNIAMPGILKEALMIRGTALKPTWVVEEMGHPFADGHFSWSTDVEDYIQKNFQRIDLDPGDFLTEVKRVASESLPDDPDLPNAPALRTEPETFEGTGDAEEATPAPEETPEMTTNFDLDSVIGDGGSKYKKTRRGKWGGS
jgi:hypothetical protein